jgi:hypothetical protein
VRLQSKLAIFGAGTALLAVLLVALISSVSTKVEVTKIVAENQREQARSTIDMIRRWRDEQGSWQGADRLFAETATAEHQQLLVLGTDNHCVKSFPAGLCKMHISIGPGDELTIGSIGPQDEDIRVLVGVPEIVVTDGQKTEQGGNCLFCRLNLPGKGSPTDFSPP